MSATLDRPTVVNSPDQPRPHRPLAEATALTAGQAEWVARIKDEHPFHVVSGGNASQVFVYRFYGPMVFRDLLDASGEVIDSVSFRAGPGDRERARQLRAERAVGTAEN